MDDRAKLIELCEDVVIPYWAKILANHLIANGVTFATDNNVGGKWIPVTERLPKVGEWVIVCLNHRLGGRTVSPMLFFCETYGFWRDATHWMPLPPPPEDLSTKTHTNGAP